MPESVNEALQRSRDLSSLLAAIEQSIEEGELGEAVVLSRTLNERIRSWCQEPQDAENLLDADSRVQLLLGRTAALRSELMLHLRDSRRKRQAVQAYQTT